MSVSRLTAPRVLTARGRGAATPPGSGGGDLDLFVLDVALQLAEGLEDAVGYLGHRGGAAGLGRELGEHDQEVGAAVADVDDPGVVVDGRDVARLVRDAGVAGHAGGDAALGP